MYWFGVFFGTVVWNQGLTLARQMPYHFSHSANPFCVGYFWARVSRAIFPGWLWAVILLLGLGTEGTDEWVSIPSPTESTMSPAPWGDTGSHKSATGLIDRMLSRLFPLIRGKQTSSSKRARACESETNGKNPPNPYPNPELKCPQKAPTFTWAGCHQFPGSTALLQLQPFLFLIKLPVCALSVSCELIPKPS
jgi:hypothetical protein